jgi:hypothetical protein
VYRQSPSTYAAVVFSREYISSEEELGVPGVQPSGQLLVEVLQVLYELFPGLNLGFVVSF